jgi:hypothetical protein
MPVLGVHLPSDLGEIYGSLYIDIPILVEFCDVSCSIED